MVSNRAHNQDQTQSIFLTAVSFLGHFTNTITKTLTKIFTRTELSLVILILLGAHSSLATANKTDNKTVRILFIQLGTRGLVQSLQQHIGRDFDVQITRVPVNNQSNPFLITNDGFHVGNSRPTENETYNYPPIAQDLSWFDQYDPKKNTPQALNEILPDILVVSGHAIAGLGWHSDDMDAGENNYKMNLYLAGLVHTLRSNAGARNLFKNIKLVVLGGCNSLVNFEPHYTNGAYLNPQQIAAIYNYQSNKNNQSAKSYVVGNAASFNTLDFYRRRLARLYPEDFTLDPFQERCAFRVARLAPDHCQILDLNRVLPDYGLFNDSHMYNYPYIMKRIFPKAALILGFSGSSDFGPKTKEMLFETLQDSLQELNKAGAGLQNIITPILDKESQTASRELKIKILESMRKNWTVQTYRGLGRVGSSITPAFPEIDANGPFPNLIGDSRRIQQIESEAPPCAPYEENKFTNCAFLPEKFKTRSRPQ